MTFDEMKALFKDNPELTIDQLGNESQLKRLDEPELVDLRTIGAKASPESTLVGLVSKYRSVGLNPLCVFVSRKHYADMTGCSALFVSVGTGDNSTAYFSGIPFRAHPDVQEGFAWVL